MTCKTSFKAHIQSKSSEENGQASLYDPRIAFEARDEAEEKLQAFHEKGNVNYSAKFGLVIIHKIGILEWNLSLW